MTVSTGAAVIGAVFALLAALFWLGSAFVNLPVIGSAFGTIANLEPFYAALKRVARLNGVGPTRARLGWVRRPIARRGAASCPRHPVDAARESAGSRSGREASIA